MEYNDSIHNPGVKSQCAPPEYRVGKRAIDNANELFKWLSEVLDIVENAMVEIVVSGTIGAFRLDSLIISYINLRDKFGDKAGCDLDVIITNNTCYQGKNVKKAKLLFERLVFLCNLYASNRAIFDGIDAVGIIKRTIELYEKVIAENVPQASREMQMAKTAIDGYGSEILNELRHRSARAEDNESEEECDDKITANFDDVYFSVKYHNTLMRFDGFNAWLSELDSRIEELKITLIRQREFSFNELYSCSKALVDKLAVLFEDSLDAEMNQKSVENQRRMLLTKIKIFSDNLLEDIHTLVNDNCFEDIQFEFFADCLNNPVPPIQLMVKKDKVKKVCYLIGSLANALPYEQRKKWEAAIVKALNINAGTYKSKRRECVGANSTDDDLNFATAVNEILIKSGVDID